ncbi:hypothetical protein MMC29_000847 [Sticta canariensis]|nr:hypothetical protein [Sticta canariensis]
MHGGSMCWYPAFRWDSLPPTATLHAVQERPALQGAKKRIVMISNFLNQAAGDADDPFLEAIVDRLNEKDILLEIISIDVVEQDRQQQEAKDINLAIVKRIMQQEMEFDAQVRHKHRSVSQPIELLGVLSTREYAHTAYYSGPLSIGNMMNIKVKTLIGSFASLAAGLQKDFKADASINGELLRPQQSRGHVLRQESYHHLCGSRLECSVPWSQLCTSSISSDVGDISLQVQYGRQAVPISEADEKSLSYSPEKCFELVGFVRAEEVPPRHFYIKRPAPLATDLESLPRDVQDTWVVAPEKDNARAQLAISALQQAMERAGIHAIARFVPRANGAVQMGLLTPRVRQPDETPDSQPDCLWMNILPFTEDIRVATFASFDGHKHMPKPDQLQAMRTAMESMRLRAAGRCLTVQSFADDARRPLTNLHAGYAFMFQRSISAPTMTKWRPGSACNSQHAVSGFQRASGQHAVLHGADERVPDATVNPLLLRFSSFISSLVVDPASQVPEHDMLMDSTIRAQERPSAAQTALQRLTESFPLKAGHALNAKKRGKDVATQEQQASKEDVTAQKGGGKPPEAEHENHAEVKDESMAEAEDLGPGQQHMTGQMPDARSDMPGIGKEHCPGRLNYGQMTKEWYTLQQWPSTPRGRSGGGLQAGVPQATGGAFSARPAPTDQRAWSSSAGQALDLLKKTADNILKAQQTSQDTSDVTDKRQAIDSPAGHDHACITQAQELQQAKSEITGLQRACHQEQQRYGVLLAEKKEVSMHGAQEYAMHHMSAWCAKVQLQIVMTDKTCPAAERRLHELKRSSDLLHRHHCSMQLDITQLTASLKQSELCCRTARSCICQLCVAGFSGDVPLPGCCAGDADCKASQTALHQSEQHFSAQVQEFAHLGTQYEARVDKMQSQAFARLDLFKNHFQEMMDKKQQKYRAELDEQKECLHKLTHDAEHFRAKKEAELATANMKIQQQRSITESIEQQLAQAAKRSGEDQLTIDQLKVSARTLQAHMQESQQDRHACQQALEHAQTDHSELQYNLAALKESGLQQLAALEAQLADKDHTVHELEAELTSMAETEAVQKEKLQALNEKLVSVQSQLEGHAGSISQLETSLAESKQALSAASSQLESQATRTQQEFAKVKLQHASQFQQQTEKIAGWLPARKMASMLGTFTIIAPLQVTDLTAQLTNTKQAMRADIQALTDQASQLQTSIEKADREHAERANEHHTQHLQDTSTISEQRASLAALKAQIAELQAASAATERLQQAKLQEASICREELEKESLARETALQKQLQHCMEEAAFAKDQVAQINAQLQSQQQAAKAAARGLEETLSQKENELEGCASEASAMRQQLYHAANKIEGLESALEEQSIELTDKMQAVKAARHFANHEEWVGCCAALLLQQISHHAAQPASDPSPHRPTAHPLRYAGSSPKYQDCPRIMASPKAWTQPANVDASAGDSTDDEADDPVKKPGSQGRKLQVAKAQQEGKKVPSAKPGASTATASRKRGSIFTSMSAHNSGQVSPA